MNLSALFKIFAVLLAKRDNFDGGSLNGTVSPTASLQIDLNTGEVLSNKNGTIDNSNEIDASHQGVSLQPIASDPSVPKQLDVDDGQNGITALEVRPSPGGMIAIPYFPHESDRVGPKAALKNCVKRFKLDKNIVLFSACNFFVVFQYGRANFMATSQCLRENWRIQYIQLRIVSDVSLGTQPIDAFENGIHVHAFRFQKPAGPIFELRGEGKKGDEHQVARVGLVLLSTSSKLSI